MALYPISAYDGATVISSTLLVFVLQKINIFHVTFYPDLYIYIVEYIKGGESHGAMRAALTQRCYSRYNMDKNGV